MTVSYDLRIPAFVRVFADYAGLLAGIARHAAVELHSEHRTSPNIIDLEEFIIDNGFKMFNVAKAVSRPIGIMPMDVSIRPGVATDTHYARVKYPGGVVARVLVKSRDTANHGVDHELVSGWAVAKMADITVRVKLGRHGELALDVKGNPVLGGLPENRTGAPDDEEI